MGEKGKQEERELEKTDTQLNRAMNNLSQSIALHNRAFFKRLAWEASTPLLNI